MDKRRTFNSTSSSDAAVVAFVLAALAFCAAVLAADAWVFGKLVEENAWFFEQQLALVSHAIETVQRWCGF